MQYSLLGLIASVTVVAFGMGAISFPSAWMASVVYTLYFGWMAIALVGALARRGGNRVFWLGSFVCGAMYYHAAIHSLNPWEADRSRNVYSNPYMVYGGWSSYPAMNAAGDEDYSALAEQPDLVTTKILDWIADRKLGALQVGQHVQAQYMGMSLFPGKVLGVTDDGMVTVAWDDQAPPQSSVRKADVFPDGTRPNRSWLHKTGHSGFGFLFAFFGGWLAWGVFPVKENEKASGS